MKQSRAIIYTSTLMLPYIVYGQTFGTLVDGLVDIINTLITIVMAASLVVFFYGMARYVYKMGTGSAGSYRDGYSLMFWGVLVFFVMGSIWGIVNLVASSIF